MLATSSQLSQISFDIIKSKISTVFGENPTADLLEITKAYPVDIDFSFNIPPDNSLFAILIKITINPEEQPGYSILTEAAGVFSISGEIEEAHKQQLIYAALNICVTNLRAYISSTTSFYAIGRFSFNVIDMVSLIKNKISK